MKRVRRNERKRVRKENRVGKGERKGGKWIGRAGDGKGSR